MIDFNSSSSIQYGQGLLALARNLLRVTPLIIAGMIVVSCTSTTSTSYEVTDVSRDTAIADESSETTAAPTTVAEGDVAEGDVAEGDVAEGDVAEGDVAEGDGTFPDVIAAEATRDDDGSWTFAVTISSPYDSPDRYADAWRVSNADGEVYGIRELAHDHASEQPFTRTKSGIEIPEDVTEVTVSGRDQLNGWGGGTVVVVLP